jgi:hypothetical protein
VLGDMPLARLMEKEVCGEAVEEGGVEWAAAWSRNGWRGVAVGGEDSQACIAPW